MIRRPTPPPIYALADAGALAPRSISDAVARMAEAGVRWIQIRAKTLSDSALQQQVELSLEELSGSDVDLWINDRVDLAALNPVQGVHLGQRDLPAAAARRVMGSGVWIGASTHSEEELLAAAADPEVDLIAVGPVFGTSSKARARPQVGVELVRRAREISDKPLVAIGGIDPSRVERVLEAGADSVAILGSVCSGALEENLARWDRWL